MMGRMIWVKRDSAGEPPSTHELGDIFQRAVNHALQHAGS
jgi:hypothetical protein